MQASSQTPRREITDSSNSQQVPSTPQFTIPRSNAWRHCAGNSIGANTPTLLSPPVIVRVHSADASTHLDPAPRLPPPVPIMKKADGIPDVSDYSIDGILAAIQPDIEGTIDAIAEIMGRSRLTLANEYDSHMPPQGEIRAGSHSPLFPVEEASSSNERLAADNVIIVGEDASLVEGSVAGSAAYGLLERLGQVQRPRRERSDVAASWAAGSSNTPVRTISSPAALPRLAARAETRPVDTIAPATPMSRALLSHDTALHDAERRTSRTTDPLVSETYLHAGANGRPSPSAPIVSSAGRNYPLYSYDESDLFELPSPVSGLRSFQYRLQNFRLATELQSLTSWLRRDGAYSSERRQDAQTRLRGILERHGSSVGDGMEIEPEIPGDADLYD